MEYDIWSNELGCFDQPYHGEKDVILLVGDSFTHCYAPLARKWGTRIENLLDYRVLKCGVSGYGTRQEYLKAGEIIGQIKTRPRLMIVGYFWNDLSDDRAFPNLTVIDGFLVNPQKYQDKLPQGGYRGQEYTFWDKLNGTYPLSLLDLLGYFLRQHLILPSLIGDTLAEYLPAKDSGVLPISLIPFQDELWTPRNRRRLWEPHLENLKLFQELARANGAKLLVVIIPANIQVYPYLGDWGTRDPARPNKILGEFLQAEKINYIDLLPFFKQYADPRPRKFLDADKDLYWRYNSHWSLKGERLAGLLVARHILADNLVQVADRDKKLRDIQDQLRDFH